MAIPLSYNFRNLKLRKGLTIMTALGTRKIAPVKAPASGGPAKSTE